MRLYAEFLRHKEKLEEDRKRSLDLYQEKIERDKTCISKVRFHNNFPPCFLFIFRSFLNLGVGIANQVRNFLKGFLFSLDVWILCLSSQMVTIF